MTEIILARILSQVYMLLNYINAKKCQAKLVKNPYGVRAAKISHHVLWLHHQKLIQLIRKQGLLEVTSSPAVNCRDQHMDSTQRRCLQMMEPLMHVDAVVACSSSHVATGALVGLEHAVRARHTAGLFLWPEALV